DRTVALGQDTQAYHLRRARYLILLQNPNAAEVERRKARQLEGRPTSAVDHFLMGVLLADPTASRKDWKEATDHFEAAVRLQPGQFWAHYLAAIVYLNLQKPELAKAGLSACQSLQPDFVWIYILKGFVHPQLAPRALEAE